MGEAGEVREAGRKGRWPATEAPEGPSAPALSSWDIGHIWAVPARRRKCFLLESGHGVLVLRGKGGLGPEGSKVARGEIYEWSRRSRARLVQQVSAVNWDALDVVFIVLTWGKRWPKDGLEAHQSVKAFWRAWERRFGAAASGVWKKEFQKRGVIHYSMWLVLPEGESVEAVDRWARETWWRIAGYGDPDHLLYGVHCKEYKGSPLGYLMKECFAAGKEYQNIAPPGFHTGRWWGFIGGLRPVWDEQVLSWRQGVQVRRLLGRYLRSKGYRAKVLSDIQGVWASMLPETRRRVLEWVGQALTST